MKIYESAEDYLEAILVLRNRLGIVRSIDIVNELNLSKPSVSIAMKKLRENGFISMDSDGHISLLESGEAIAVKIYERHTTLTKFFCMIGVPEDIAAADACRVEHVLTEETFAAIKAHVREGERILQKKEKAESNQK